MGISRQMNIPDLTRCGLLTHLGELELGTITSSDIGELDACVGLHVQFGLGLAHVERVHAAAAAHGSSSAESHARTKECEEEKEREGQIEEGSEDRREHIRARRWCCSEAHIVLQQKLNQFALAKKKKEEKQLN